MHFSTRALAAPLTLLALTALPATSQVNILTANGDNLRTNTNLHEARLTPSTVTPRTFGKLGSFPVDGQVYAQPLYLNQISIPGKGTLNVVLISTMHNTVYAYDADAVSSPVPLWKVNLGPTVPSSQLFPGYADVEPEVGILATGAVDLERNVIYVVAQVLESGAPAFYLHALDIATGAEKLNGPVLIRADGPGTPPAFLLDASKHLQRTGLLVANGAVYFAFGSIGDQIPWHGWVLSYDASDISRQLGVFVATSTGMGGGIWQSGRGLAADDENNVYAITGNGEYDGVHNFGQSFVKLAGTGMTLADWFTPADWQSMEDNDGDLSAGPALVPGARLVIGADKYGRLYVADMTSMGKLGGAQNFLVRDSALIFNFAVWSLEQSTYVYVQGRGDTLKCFEITGGKINRTPLSATSTTDDPARFGITLSANGADASSGILWKTTMNLANGAGTLHAYDASNLGIELWNSDMNGERDAMGSFVKFTNPTVANGKVYAATSSNAVTVYGPLTGDAQSTPEITSVLNAASNTQGPIAPGEMITIIGSNLGPQMLAGAEIDTSGRIATSIGRVRVLFDDVPAPIFSAEANRITVIAPFEISSPATHVQIESEQQLSHSVTVEVAPSSPGIFSVDGSGGGQALVINQDGSLNSSSDPAHPGSIVAVYATGGGATSPAGRNGAVVAADSLPYVSLAATARVGDQPADVMYAGGAPGMAEGILQVNIRVPDNVADGDSIPLVVTIGDRASQAGTTIAVRTVAAGTGNQPSTSDQMQAKPRAVRPSGRGAEALRRLTVPSRQR